MTSKLQKTEDARSGRTFFLFVYGVAGGAGSTELPDGCERVDSSMVSGTLYDIDKSKPGLVLAGPGRVEGEIWRCPVEVLPELDRIERVETGLFRRVGVQAGAYPCWVYVAGPKLADRLVPDRRVDSD
jgi:gamma-glutamylcyclotransferase (GGCT)/AIG2-like uncharacterized protein YtfP